MPLPLPPNTKAFMVTARRLSDGDVPPEVMFSDDDRTVALAKLIELRALLPAYGDWLLNGGDF